MLPPLPKQTGMMWANLNLYLMKSVIERQNIKNNTYVPILFIELAAG